MTCRAILSPDMAFLAFHAERPGIYRLFVHFAREAKKSGRTTIGAKMIAERIRWECVISRSDGDAWKLNNNMVSRYARMVMQNEPDLVGFFETRKLKTASGSLPLGY